MRLESVPAIQDGGVNMLVEIPVGSTQAKYEFCHKSGALRLDRLLKTPVFYPCTYGFVVNTKAGDGDELDVLLHCHATLLPGVLLHVRPVGVLYMEDEKGRDDKILSVLSCDAEMQQIQEHTDLPPHFLERFSFFFEQYKTMDSGRHSKTLGWGSASEAWKLIRAADLTPPV